MPQLWVPHHGLTGATLPSPAQPRVPATAPVSCSPPTSALSQPGDVPHYRCQPNPCSYFEDRGPSCSHPLLHQPCFTSMVSPYIPNKAGTGHPSFRKETVPPLLLPEYLHGAQLLLPCSQAGLHDPQCSPGNVPITLVSWQASNCLFALPGGLGPFPSNPVPLLLLGFLFPWHGRVPAVACLGTSRQRQASINQATQ